MNPKHTPSQSMTGFGQAHIQSQCCRLTLNIKSVNNRFLDLTLKVPEELSAFEHQIREMVNQKVKRGKVECKLQWQINKASDHVEQVNQKAILDIIHLQNQILEIAPKASPLSIQSLLNQPGVIPSNIGAPEALGAVTPDEMKQLIEQAMSQFISSREQEGLFLVKTLLERLDNIETIVLGLSKKLPELLQIQQDKLAERLFKVLDTQLASGISSISKDEMIERIRQETSVTAIRIDVAEEIDRINAHIQKSRAHLTEGGQIGKRLDFLMQEFNREANTLGSKSASIEQTQASLELKLIIEQMREQVQNLE